MTTNNKEFVLSTGDLMKIIGGISATILAITAIGSLIMASGAQSKQVVVNEQNIHDLSAENKAKEKRLRNVENNVGKLQTKVGNIDSNVEHIKKAIDEMRKENAKKKK